MSTNKRTSSPNSHEDAAAPPKQPTTTNGTPTTNRWVPIQKAELELKNFCLIRNLNEHDTRVLTLWLKSHPTTTGKDGIEYIPLNILQDTFINFAKYVDSGDPDRLTEKRGFKPGRIVDPIEFIESKQFVGRTIRAWIGVKDNLVQIFKGITEPDTITTVRPFEIVLTGSIRGGKSFTVHLAFEYILYLLSRLHDPYAQYGLSPGRPIVLVCQATTQEKAERVLLKPMRLDLDASPYFSANFSRNKDINSKILMPNGIEVLPMVAKETAAMGENVYTYAQTESNTMEVIKNSKKLRHSNKEEYDTARELYTVAHERINATFKTSDKFFFGKIFCDSSVDNPHDFAHQKIEEKKENPEAPILIINKTIWEAQGPPRYPTDEPTFLVEVGDNHRSPRIIDSEDDAINEVLRVPEQLRTYFVTDIELALKNFAGRVTHVTGSFLPFKDKITKAQTEYEKVTGGQTLFLHNEVSFIDLFGQREPGEPIDWERLINYEYIKTCIADTSAPFTIRFDLSATEDATGFAIGRIMDYKLLETTNVFNQRTGQYEQEKNAQQPIIIIDGLLRVVARHGEWIDPDIIARLGIELNNHLAVKWGTGDTAESSRHILIQWRMHKIWSTFYSVDTNLRPAIELKNALREERLLFPPNEIADKEMRTVRRVTKNGKPRLDHVTGGSKDLFDAIQGCVFVLMQKEAMTQSTDTLVSRRTRGEGGIERKTHGTGSHGGRLGKLRRVV